MRLALLITAAGSSTRFGGVKKEYLPLTDGPCSETVLASSAETFLKTGLFSFFVVTIPRGDDTAARAALFTSEYVTNALTGGGEGMPFAFTYGGSSRQESVFMGLQKIAELATEHGEMPPDAVLIHDGARPWVTKDIIFDTVRALDKSGAAVCAVPATDTQKAVDGTGKITTHLARETIYAVQTPQAFLFSPLLEAHRKAAGDGFTYTDDTEIWARYCGDVYISRGDVCNKKITYKGDI